MVFRNILTLSELIIISALCYSTDYSIPISTQSSPECKHNHWRHDAANSAIEIEGIEIDIMQWQVATESRESVKVDIINERWEITRWINGVLELPNFIEISILSNFRGTPIIHLQVTPWRFMDGRIEVLTQGEIQISVDPVDFPITYSHPYLLNGKKINSKRRNSDNTQYLIICPRRFESAALSLAHMYNDSVDTAYQLNTEVITIDKIINHTTESDLNYAIREYIQSRINDDLQFLLLLGDEFDVPPIFNGNYPSDDFYSTVISDIYSGDPQLFSGRIPVSTEDDAWAMMDKIKNYTLRPTPGIWRSKIALVADDMYKSCSYSSGEDSHTLNSDEIYDSLKTLLSIQPFYGVRYGLQQTSSGCEYPDLTAELIRTIYNGVALINYIGHGSPETWAGEKILTKTRDLPLIQADNGKLAIWVAGTCSFGQYNGKNSFMEELLLKEDGAIAVIATTDVIGYAANSTYLFNLFGLNGNGGLQDIIKGGAEMRLGELIAQAKNGNYHKFHTFGDPAMRLPFSKYSDEIIENPPTEIPLISEENISLNTAAEYSTLFIRGNDREITYSHDTDNLTYTIPGNTYAQMNSSEKDICFRIPIDADVCENCAIMQVYQDKGDGWKGRIQTHPNISITNSETDFQDDVGPKIRLLQENNAISDGSALFTNHNLTITLSDTSGINLMETIGHGIQFKFDDDIIIQLPGSEFVYVDCDSGLVSIPVPPTLLEGFHRFYLESWDGVNNKSVIEYNLEILNLGISDNSSSSTPVIDKVFPIPNPFSDYTEFTMFILNPPAEITVTVYSLMGEKVITLDKYETKDIFTSIPWDGKDRYGRKIANGAYFYHIKADKDGDIIFEDIFKLAKVE